MKLMVIGFPKSGTTTITHALEASGLKAAHWQDGRRHFVGQLIYRDALAGHDPFERLDGFDAVTQADVCVPAHGVNCWPQLDFSILARIRVFHPDCWFLLNTRDPAKIVDSIDRWPALRERIVAADIPGLPAGMGADDGELIAWIEGHYAACRTYFRNDPRFAEVAIESAEAPARIGAMVGRELLGWGDHKPRRPKTVDVKVLHGATYDQVARAPRR